MSSPTDAPVQPVAASSAPKPSRRRYLYWVLGVALAVLALFSMYNGPCWVLRPFLYVLFGDGADAKCPPALNSYIDLDVYRTGVRIWWHGGNMYGPLQAEHSGMHLPFIYPPFAAIALSLLALPSFTVAGLINFLLSATALTFTVYLTLRRLADEADRTVAKTTSLALAGILLPLAMWIEPVRETFGFGQVNLMLMALVAADVLSKDKTRWPRGIGVGLAAAIKLTPAIFLIYFLLRRDRRAVGTSIITGALATAVGFAVLPTESMKYWFGGLAGAGGLSGSPYAMNQTLLAVFTRMPELAKWAQQALWLVLVVVVLFAALVGIWRALYGDAKHGRQQVLAVVITAAAGLLISPTSWTHHYVWIVVALPLAVYYAARRRSGAWTLTAALTAVVFFVGIPGLLPRNNDLELGWAPWQHLFGNSYTLLTTVLLLCWAAPAMRPAVRAALDGMAGWIARRRGFGGVPPLQDAPDDTKPVETSPATAD